MFEAQSPKAYAKLLRARLQRILYVDTVARPGNARLTPLSNTRVAKYLRTT